MSQLRREILPFFNNSAYHPAFAIALSFLPKLRRLTARGGPNELHKNEQIGCLAGVAAVLAFERLGMEAELPVETARRLASATKTHFTSALNHCRPLVIAQRASASRPSSATPPSRPGSGQAGSAASPSTPTSSKSARPQSASPSPSTRQASIDPLALLGQAAMKPRSPVVGGQGKKLDLSGLRRNNASGSEAVAAPITTEGSAAVAGEQVEETDTANVKDSIARQKHTPRTSVKAAREAAVPVDASSEVPDELALPPTSPSTSQPLPRTPPKVRSSARIHTPSPSKPSASGSPMHAGLMRGRLEALRASGRNKQAAPLAAEHGQPNNEDLDEDMPMEGIIEEGNNAIAGPSTSAATHPPSHRVMRNRPRPPHISSTIIPISPYISIPVARIDPLAPYFTSTNQIYPPPQDAKDRIFGKMVVPDDAGGGWPEFRKRARWGVEEMQEEKAEAREQAEDRRNKRRARQVASLVEEYEAQNKEETLEPASAVVTVGSGRKRKRRRFDWDAAFYISSSSFDVSQDAEKANTALLSGDDFTWQDRLDDYCQQYLSQLRSVLPLPGQVKAGGNAETTLTADDRTASESARSAAWLERADTRGIGVRLWAADEQ